MEAIILAGGKAERLGDAAGGRPKALVEVAGRRSPPIRSSRLARAGVERVIFACAAGRGALFERGARRPRAEIVAAEEPERLGRGGGIKFAARLRQESGDVYALNGDELVDVDFAALLDAHAPRARSRRSPSRSRSRSSASSTIDDDDVVARLPRGRARPVLGQLRQLRPLGGGDRALPGARRPRVDDVPGARGGGDAARLPP